ncbi:MAG TPA: CapA family protein, partial [Candidatus Limnocylindrales bacterium]
MNRRPLFVVSVLLGVALVATALGLGVGSAWTGLGGGQASVPASQGTPSSSTFGQSSSWPASPSASPIAAGSPSISPSPVVATGPVPIVPVTSFRSTLTSTTRGEVSSVLAGTSRRYDALELVAAETGPILAALDVAPPADATRLLMAVDASALAADLAKHSRRLAILRADAVTPAVRALAWGDKALFGVGRVGALADWPLNASLPSHATGAAYDPATTWTLFAGGDILLDRGVYQTVKLRRKGVDFPFNGGTAEITSRYCCSTLGWELPRTQRTGNAGAVRNLIDGADLAIANFENPAPDRPRYHTSGTVFSADPALIDGLADAGIDYVSVANNHIRDAGGAGLLQTIANLKQDGIASSGAGKNLAAARRPSQFTVNGTTVAILAYDAIAASYHATATRIGSAPLVASYVREDIKAARAAGADVVIVFPHWGTEYRSKPSAAQQALARTIIDAGADMIIGNHAHRAAAMEVYKGKPIWYALGNFVFDQTWS